MLLEYPSRRFAQLLRLSTGTPDELDQFNLVNRLLED